MTVVVLMNTTFTIFKLRNVTPSGVLLGRCLALGIFHPLINTENETEVAINKPNVDSYFSAKLIND